MPSDPLHASARLRQLLSVPLGRVRFDGEDLQTLLDEIDRVERFREALRHQTGEQSCGPPPSPQNLAFVSRLREELSRPAGQGRITRRQLLGLLEDWDRLLRLEAYIQHHPSCPAHLPDPWSRRGYEALRVDLTPCTCGFDAAYAGVEARAAARPPPARRAAG